MKTALECGFSGWPGPPRSPTFRIPKPFLIEFMTASSNPADHPGVAGTVLARNLVCSPANDAEHGDRPAGSVVSQTQPDLLRCFGAGTQGVMGTRDFSALAPRAGHGKSPAGVCGASNRNALLCSLNG